MKVIQSTYSLEWVISRLPSIYPSYNGSDEIVYFDEKSINDRNGEYTSNYGMIPLNVPRNLLDELKNNEDYKFDKDFIFVNDSYLSWNTLSEWYSFFQNYYHILNNSGSCNRVYSSVTDFYDAEYSVSSVELPLGSNRDSYEEYDLLFKERGGYICKSVLECEGANSVDIGFFKFINDYIVPSFEIPSENKEYWHTDRIFYPDIIKWISWFENKKKEYDSKGSSETPIDCAKSDNCCACEEYIQRGGSKLLDSFKMWYKVVNEKIDIINNYVLSNINNVDWHFKPYAFKEIPIFNSFEKTCLQSNLSEEYNVNVDYRHSNGNIDNEKNTMGGTVVNVSGKTMFFKDNDGHDVESPGSIFDKYHMERKYDPDAFTDYTDHYISKKEKKKEYNDVKFWVTDEYTCYGVNKDNIKKFGKNKDDVKNKFNRSIPLDTNNGNGWFVFEDRMLECEPIETLELEDGKVIPVFRDDNTNTPFVTMGGKNIYPEFNFKDNAYRFSFGKDKLFPRNEMNTDSDYSCVNNNGNIKVFETDSKYQGVTYILSNGSPITYPYSYGYIDVDDYRLCVCDKKWFSEGKDETGKTIATIYPFEEVDPNHEIYEYNESDKSITIKDKDIKCFRSDVITGTTSSKLLELRSSNIMTDDSGNIIEALNLLASNNTNKDRYYVQPLLGEELEPLYQVGNVSSISPFSLTYKDYDDKEKKTIRYVGNIISKMEFYFCDKDGNIVQKKYDEDSGTLVDDELLKGIFTIDLKSKDKSSLNAIKPIMKAMEVYMNQSPTNVISNGLQCNITYNIGATLKMNVDENGSTKYTIDESEIDKNEINESEINERVPQYSGGVQYTETVEFVKTKVEYYLGNDNVSYPIYIYKLKQGESEEASFMARIDIFSKLVEKDNNVKIVDKYSSEREGMEKYNGIEVCPTFTRAFNIGVVSLPTVVSDVNIDRGNSAAFEKHLKLGEVTSFEALENYSNGYFKIMEN